MIDPIHDLNGWCARGSHQTCPGVTIATDPCACWCHRPDGQMALGVE